MHAGRAWCLGFQGSGRREFASLDLALPNASTLQKLWLRGKPNGKEYRNSIEARVQFGLLPFWAIGEVLTYNSAVSQSRL